MRAEKDFWVQETAGYLSRGDYLFLTDFNQLKVDEIKELRTRLLECEAEFHVVKNSILRKAIESSGMPPLDEFLAGQTAIIIGGEDISGIAKRLLGFHKETEKAAFKVGVVGSQIIDAVQAKALASMPPVEVLQAQLLGLIQRPQVNLLATLNELPRQVVRVLSATPLNFLGVLQAKIAKG